MVFESPYQGLSRTDWFKGNLHTHTTVSDGPCSVEETVTGYAALGHDFIAISDHDKLVEPGQRGVDHSIEMIPAVEVSANGPHLLHIGASEEIEPLSDRRTVADLIATKGGIAVAAHPRWGPTYEHWPYETLHESQSLRGIEIHNAHIKTLRGSADAVSVWDRLLTEGYRLWGFANDDMHTASRMGLAYNVVAAEEPTAAMIVEALANGRFYASTGVHIKSIEVDGSVVQVCTENAEMIRFVTDHGIVQRAVKSPMASLRVPGALPYGSDYTYLRIECFGRRGTRAWSQPLFFK